MAETETNGNARSSVTDRKPVRPFDFEYADPARPDEPTYIIVRGRRYLLRMHHFRVEVADPVKWWRENEAWIDLEPNIVFRFEAVDMEAASRPPEPDPARRRTMLDLGLRRPTK